MPALQLRTTHHDDREIVSIVGPVTHNTTGALRDHLRRIIGTEHTTEGADVLLDLSCCTTVDVDGLLALDVAQQAALAGGGRLHLTRVPPLIERLLYQYNLVHLIGDPHPGQKWTIAARPLTARGGESEVPEADAIDQNTPAVTNAAEPPALPDPIPLEADPVDVVEQALVADIDDDSQIHS